MHDGWRDSRRDNRRDDRWDYRQDERRDGHRRSRSPRRGDKDRMDNETSTRDERSQHYATTDSHRLPVQQKSGDSLDKAANTGSSHESTPDLEVSVDLVAIPDNANLQDEKKREGKRLARIEKLRQWKLQKEAEAQREGNQPASVKPILTDNKPKPVSMGFKAAAKPTEQKARRLAFDDDDQPKRAPPAKLTGMFSAVDDDVEMEHISDEDVDPLDVYMSSITTGVAITAAPLPARVMDEDEGERIVDGEGTADPEQFMEMMEKKKRKDIPQVDHSKIDYEPFRKNFYVEPRDLAEMTSREVDLLRLELDGIKVSGVNCPKPCVKWEQFGIPAPTMEVIRSLGYDKPTSIQCQAIPAIMSGRDVIGVAKTGSGKTMAFLLPMFRHIKDQRSLANLEGPIALIMTPTRELAVQIFKECKPFLKALNLRAVCAYGGSPIKDQIADMKRGAEIVVCTPGRMIDLLTANSGRVTNLSRVTYLVLDEADRMFDMGFEPQVMKIVNNIRPGRQTVLFSATFPRQMEALARKILCKPVEIIVGARSVVAPEISQIVEIRDEKQKFLRALEILGDFFDKNPTDARALIFVDRQEACDELLKSLLARGYPCLSIHGGKDQVDRDSAISDFKHGVVSLLIATSVAARGLDVKQLKLVINYDAPNHMEDYVHRVGRTGRAGNSGTAVTFIAPDQERSALDISKALKLSKSTVPLEVQELADKFLAKVKGGKERFGSGFGGKGLERLDEERSIARKRERKAFGEEEEIEQEEDASDIEAEATKETTPAQESKPTTPATLTIGPAVIQAGHHASSSAGNLKGKVRAGAAPDNKGPDTAAFHTTLEINDFPQQARWAATNNANIVKIIEANSTSITTKGVFYAPGKTPGPNDLPKLYILIEGQTEASVANAHKALVALLMGGIETAAMEGKKATGRYTV
jgi:ATP-dependent RNA helicase DDX46/PRP5